MSADKFPPFTFTKAFHNSVYPAIDPTSSKLSASGKTILVTGGGRGLGKAIASSFALAGARAIILLGRTASSLEDAAKELLAIKEDLVVRTISVDVRDGESITSAVKAAREELGPIDTFISNAGDFHYGNIADCDPKEYWNNIEINVLGAQLCASLPSAWRRSASHGRCHPDIHQFIDRGHPYATLSRHVCVCGLKDRSAHNDAVPPCGAGRQVARVQYPSRHGGH